MKAVRFVCLAAVLAMIFWLPARQGAMAYPTNPCYLVNGTQCFSPNTQRVCWDSICPIQYQGYLTCTCSWASPGVYKWSCQPSKCLN